MFKYEDDAYVLIKSHNLSIKFHPSSMYMPTLTTLFKTYSPSSIHPLRTHEVPTLKSAPSLLPLIILHDPYIHISNNSYSIISSQYSRPAVYIGTVTRAYGR